MGRTTLSRIEAADPEALVVYAAEDAAAGGLRRFARFAHLDEFVASVVCSEFWDRSFPDAPSEVVVDRRHRDATFSAAATRSDGSAVVWVTDGEWGLHTVLHELAHVAAPHAKHSQMFRDVLVLLWREYAGVQAAAALLFEFRARDLDVTWST